MTTDERRDIALAFATLAVIAVVGLIGLAWALFIGALHWVWDTTLGGKP